MTIETSATLEGMNRAATLLPAMLGATEPRNYILLFQNPAELRSTGGIPGALELRSTPLIALNETASLEFTC
ncbi:DUF4012 domain-containing protein [Cryobacterium suzukii]|uniref:DUF4012 domain-containing protein n=1 Tax=Cryobacterium suzukii TaxID=1259198 RepID=UPI003B96DB1E